MHADSIRSSASLNQRRGARSSSSVATLLPQTFSLLSRAAHPLLERDKVLANHRSRRDASTIALRKLRQKAHQVDDSMTDPLDYDTGSAELYEFDPATGMGPQSPWARKS